MNITIEVSTEEKAETILSFAQAVETGSLEGIEVLHAHNSGKWVKKSGLMQFRSASSYRRKPAPTIEDYLKGHNEYGIKVGDRVRVTRAASRGEGGWYNSWLPHMDNCIGRTLTVTSDSNSYGFGLEGGVCRFPYFVLEKVKPTYRPWTPEEAIGKVVRGREITSVLQTIISANENTCRIGGTGCHKYADVLRLYAQLDGTPCGVLEGIKS